MTSFYSIMVVDIENFSSRPDPVQRSLRAAMYEVMASAAGDAHLPWDRFVTEDRGDGMLVIIPPEVSPVSLAGDLVEALHRVLAEKALMYSAAHSLRLRAALHHGLASRDERGWSGDAVNFTFRLCDAGPARQALRDAAGAYLAFVVSDDVYRSVIRHGYRSIESGSFTAISFDAKHLGATPAWVYVPGGHVVASQPAPAGERPAGPASPGGAPPRPDVNVGVQPEPPAQHGGSSVNISGGTVNGPVAGRDIHMGDYRGDT